MTKCLAPWTHTYCSPQGERRLCCASREPAQNFKQYIDTEEASGDFHIPSLDEHWNSEHMKRIRREMMDGKLPKECEVCDKKLLNTDVYRDHFEYLFAHKRMELENATMEDGTLKHLPISFDYRFSNLCNFKCRMCGPMLSSQWESEARKHNPDIEKFEPWLKFKKELTTNEFNMYEELKNEISKGTLEEIYWVGGEPLMFSQHWDIMIQLRRTGYKDIYVRYNTNLSNIFWPKAFTKDGLHLFHLLEDIRDWQVCASIDGTGVIGEYIRTGLEYDKFRENFEIGLSKQKKPGQMRLDFTLTTPGLFEVRNMFNLSKEYNAPLLSKVCFEFGSDVAMCPLWLPKDVLHPIVQELIDELEPRADRNQRPLIDVLKNLLTRDTMEYKYHDYVEGRVRGKKRIEKLEAIRMQPITMQEIFAQHSEAALDFWNSIDG